jgi:uncharacterized Zn finger protein
VRTTCMFPAYAWPGGYPLFYFDNEGAILCPKCAREFAHQVLTDKEGKPLADINWEDPKLYCDECGKRIETAYAEED